MSHVKKSHGPGKRRIGTAAADVGFGEQLNAIFSEKLPMDFGDDSFGDMSTSPCFPAATAPGRRSCWCWCWQAGSGGKRAVVDKHLLVMDVVHRTANQAELAGFQTIECTIVWTVT